MFNILVTNVYSKILYDTKQKIDYSLTEKCLNYITSRMMFFDPLAKYSEKYNTINEDGKRMWDGHVRFFNPIKHTFLTGLLPFVLGMIDKHNIPYKFINKYTIPNITPKPIYECGEFKLRDYQVEGVQRASERNRGVFYQATGAGKSLLAIAITESIPVRTLFLVDRVELLVQTYKKFKDSSTRKIGIITPQEFKPEEITIGLQRTIYSRLKNKFTKEEMNTYLNTVEMAFFDECLSPDTEILTDKGWKLIRKLDKSEKVAQWDNNTENVDFVFPTKYIEKEFDGNMIHWKSRHIDFLATPNHQQPYRIFYNKSKIYRHKKNEIQYINCLTHTRIPITGNSYGNAKLTPYIQFLIMTQADGYISVLNKTTNYRIVQFSFRKERKINRFFEIVNECGFKWKEHKKYANKRRFSVEAPLDITKKLYNIISLVDINPKFADAFIDELTRWDGSRKKTLYYSTTDSKMADMVQAICALGGWGCGRSIEHDNRQPQYKSVHRLYFYKRRYRYASAIKKSLVPHKGKVCCVRVPKGNIIVRRNSKVMITGNCHKASSSTWRYVLRNLHNAYYRYGLSGTPLLEDNQIRNMYMMGLVGRVIQQIKYKELIDKGYVAKPIINIISLPENRISPTADYAEVYRLGVVEFEARNELIAEKIREHRGKSILVLVKHIEHGERIKSLLKEEDGYFVSGQDTKKKRIDIYNKFVGKQVPIVIASLIYKEGVDIPAIDVLIYAIGEKAPVTILQSIGRGARIRDDKKELICYDFRDNGHYHLVNHTRKRTKIYKEEGFGVKYH